MAGVAIAGMMILYLGGLGLLDFWRGGWLILVWWLLGCRYYSCLIAGVVVCCLFAGVVVA